MTVSPHDRPIVLDADRVLAILAGGRELSLPIEPGPIAGDSHGSWLRACPGKGMDWDTNHYLREVRDRKTGRLLERGEFRMPLAEWLATLCPHRPGTLAWVREVWAPRLDADGKADPNPRYVKYRADSDAGSPCDPDDGHRWPRRWRRPDGMPRWASRLSLRIEAVEARLPLAAPRPSSWHWHLTFRVEPESDR